MILQIFKRVIKKSKIRTLLLLVCLLSLNATAWFIYATKVDTGIGAKIVAWNVSFIAGEDELLEYINFKVDSIYPGMEPYVKKIEVTNKGEALANLFYEIDSIRILDTEYVVDKSTITSEELLYSLANDYPFKIIIGVSNDKITPGEKAYFFIEVTWDYESGDDEQDSYWGSKAYDFYEENSEKECLELNLIISAVQKNKN